MFRHTARFRPIISQPHNLRNGKGRPKLTNPQLSSRSLCTKPQARPQLLKRPGIVSSSPSLHVFPRFASTASTTTSTSNFPDTSAALPDPLGANAWDPNFQDIVSHDHVTTITPHIGYLKELGVDFGWGPTSVVQWLMEHVHVYGGLPWFGTFILTACAIRVLLLPLYLRAADNTGKMSAVQPILGPAMNRMRQARMSGDQQEVMRCAKEAQLIRNRSGVSLTQTFVPMLIQVPLALGTFRLTHSLMENGVPGLETGGMLWFTDLTLAGALLPQNWIIPAMTSVLTHFSLKRGGEMGSATPEQMSLMSKTKWIFPGMSFLFTIFMAPAITIQFFTTSCLAFIQTYLFSSNRFRGMLGIHPIIKHAPTTTDTYTGTMTRPAIDTTTNQSKKPGMYANMKKEAEEWMKKRTGNSGKGLTKNEMLKANAYEKRRRQELEDELDHRRQQLVNKQSQKNDKDE